MPETIPAPVTRLIDAATGHDTDGFLAAFTPDGVVDDWGREFAGPEAIRGWSDAEFVGVDVTLDVQEVTRDGDDVTVGAIVGGRGFNGPSHFTFTVAGDRVSRMAIRA